MADEQCRWNQQGAQEADATLTDVVNLAVYDGLGFLRISQWRELPPLQSTLHGNQRSRLCD